MPEYQIHSPHRKQGAHHLRHIADDRKTAPSGLMIEDMVEGSLSGLMMQMAEITQGMMPLKTTPSRLRLPCQEIGESHEYFGHFVKYCERYCGTQMNDYGTPFVRKPTSS